MKKNKEKYMKRLQLLAMICIGIIAVLAFVTDWQVATGATMAMSLVIGGVTLEGKDEEVFTALKAYIASEQEKFSKGYITETKMLESITAKVNEIKSVDPDEFEKVKKALEDMGLTIKSMSETKHANRKSIKEQIIEQITARKAEWDAFKKREREGFTLNLDFTGKAAAEMLYSTHGNDSAREFVEAGWTDIARQQPTVIAACDYGQTDSVSYSYIQKINQEGNAAVTANGTIAPLIDFETDKVASTAQDVAARIEISEDFLMDVTGMADMIQGELKYQVDKACDDIVVTLIAAGTAFNQTGISVVSPNTLDCIRAMATQIEATGFGRANAVLMNPVNFMNMVSSKDNNANYIMLPIVTFNGTQIDNLMVYKTTQIPAGYIAVMDGMKVKVKEYGQYEAGFGYTGTNFPEYVVTLRGRRRLHTFIKSNEAGSVVYDAIADIQTAITAA